MVLVFGLGCVFGYCSVVFGSPEGISFYLRYRKTMTIN